MRKPALLLLFMLVFQLSWSQKTDTFSYTDAALDKVLGDIEQKFGVKYSYADSIVAPKRITLPWQKYTLGQLHGEIENQTALTIAKITKRYYSVYKKPEDTIMSEQLDEIFVIGFLSKGISKDEQKVVISPQKVEELPGVTDADLLLSLQQLPGVKSPNETASGLHVRGGTPDQNLILWDGIRMYHPGHLFGMISGFNPNVAQTVYYYNKATNPKFGERISSVIDIKSSDKIPENLAVSAGMNALDADIYVRTPLVKGKLGLQLSGRKSITEWIQTPTFNALADKVFQNTNFRDFSEENQFRFQDYSAKLNFTANDKNDFSVTGIVIDNHLDFSSTNEAEFQTKNQKMDIRNYGTSFNWSRSYHDRLDHKLLVYYSSYTFDYGKRQRYPLGAFDQFTKLNRITDSGLEANFNYVATDKLNIEFGYQLFGNDISHSYTTKNQDLEVELDQKQLFNLTHTGFAYFKYILDTWNFQAGARYNYFNTLKAYNFEPRAFLQKNLTDSFVWQLTYERKSQIASQVRETVTNDLSLENYVWVLSDNSEYPIQKANQYSTGFIYKTKHWTIDVDAYYKTINGITSLSFGFLNQFDSEIHMGKGFTKGIDVLVQKSAPTWRAWATYTYQDSQNKYEGLNNDDYFPINSDTKHALSVSLYKKWGHYSVAAGWFWHTGKPYSQLNGANQIVAFNDQRLPEYHRLNLSGTYQFQCARSCTGKVGVSIYNVYDQHTVISKEYEREYADFSDIITSSFTVQDYYSLGFTPNVFFRINF